MNLYDRHVYSDGQILFNRILFAFLFSLKLILKFLVYSPLLFLSWFIANTLLHDQVNKITGLVLVLLLSYILYFVIYFFKGVLIALKFNGNFLYRTIIKRRWLSYFSKICNTLTSRYIIRRTNPNC